jgi:hypothetical protein
MRHIDPAPDPALTNRPPLLVQVARARETGELGVLLQLPDAWVFMTPSDAQLVSKGLLDAVAQIEQPA